MIKTQDNDLVQKKKFTWSRKKLNSQEQIFKIVLTGIFLGIAVATSLFEIRIPLFGAMVPLRVFDILIIAFAIPIIGIWYSLIIGVLEPWLHFAIDSDHPPIQMVFDNLSNIFLVLSFSFVFYWLVKQRYQCDTQKQMLTKKAIAGLVLIPINALVVSACFVFTILVLSSTDFASHDAFIDNVVAFYQKGFWIFLVLLMIEIGRFAFVYLVFLVIQRKLGNLGR